MVNNALHSASNYLDKAAGQVPVRNALKFDNWRHENFEDSVKFGKRGQKYRDMPE